MRKNDSIRLFKERILAKKLESFSIDTIPNLVEKQEEMRKWKESLSSGLLQESKETSLDGKFLTSVFKKILGFETNVEGSSKGEWNLIPEFTSQQDSSEADATLGFFSRDLQDVRVVIELKGTNIPLDEKQYRSNHLTPVEQAFSYSHKNGTRCHWVIVSNFKEIRLYRSNDSSKFELFYLSELDNPASFKRFYYILSRDNLLCKDGTSSTDILYEDSEHADEEITQQLYQDYTQIRAQLFDALKRDNKGVDEFVLFEKAQKILDRFIFICFSEDKGLLPDHTFRIVLTNAQNTFVPKTNVIWDELKGLFLSIDEGNPRVDISRYNGGLFHQDDVLDHLTVADDALKEFKKISDCNFDSDLNVNILGHIFEQSISDIEQIKAEINGESADPKKSKKKKDGIYYTPGYVTRYIVEKTIGRWMADTRENIRQELVKDGGFKATIRGRKKPLLLAEWQEIPDENHPQQDAIIQLHIAFFEAYSERLKNLRVLDPACGSGAFLIAAFNYILSEIESVVAHLCSLRGGQGELFDINKFILQNNLYGVDINKESVEITRLSLWLQTATRGQILTSLDHAIQVGNSLISDPQVVGDLAFDWNAAFPEIMAKGGFDVVIGNPPYGGDLSPAEKEYLTQNYETTEYNFDTYKFFMERGLKLTKPGGYLGFITPNTYFMMNKIGVLRHFLFVNFTLLDIVELFNVFPTAVVEPIISIYKNTKPNPLAPLNVTCLSRDKRMVTTLTEIKTSSVFYQKDLQMNKGYVFNFRETETSRNLRHKISARSQLFSHFYHICFGIKLYQMGKGSPKQDKRTLEERPFTGFNKQGDFWTPLMRGKYIDRYTNRWNGEYVYYGNWLAEPRTPNVFQQPKILVRQTGDYPIAYLDNKNTINEATLHCLYPKEDALLSISLPYTLGILNSKLIQWIFKSNNFLIVGKPLAQVTISYLEQLPLILPSEEDHKIIVSKVETLSSSYQSLYDKTVEFTKYLTSIYQPKAITEKLKKFYTLEFKEFIDELKKQSVHLSPKEQMELMSLFEEKKKELLALSQTIQHKEDEMDAIVYQLYGLTEDEIHLVEGSL